MSVSACRDGLESEVRALIESGNVAALTTRQRLPVAVRILSPYSRAWADLLEGGPFLVLRVMRGLHLGEQHATFTRAQTVRKIRAATGRKRDIAFGLLVGEGDPDAVTLRRLAEAVRGAPLPTYDLSEGAAIESAVFEERSEANKRAAVARVQRHGASPKSGGKVVTPERNGASLKKPKPRRAPATRAERTAEAIAARSAKQLERDAESQRRLAVRSARQRRLSEDRKRKRECSEGPDELSEGISFREQVARGER